MTKPRASAVKAKPRSSESSEVESSAPTKKKVRTIPQREVDAAARERARQRSGADD